MRNSLAWFALGFFAVASFSGCAKIAEMTFRKKTDTQLQAIVDRLDNAKTAGVGGAAAAASAGDWKTAGISGIGGIAAGVLAWLARTEIKRRREERETELKAMTPPGGTS